MAKLKDLTGQRFGRLVVLSRASTIKVNTRWLCRCDCGREIIMYRNNIERRMGGCGCKRKLSHLIHGLAGTKIYHAWQNLKDRCYNKKDVGYKNYGGRGITVCDEWRGKRGFSAFQKWALQNGYEHHLTIDRINNNGNYEPSNCRWATNLEQSYNKTNTAKVIIDGIELNLKTAYERYNSPLTLSGIRTRLERGWNTKDAFTIPIQKPGKKSKKVS